MIEKRQYDREELERPKRLIDSNGNPIFILRPGKDGTFNREHLWQAYDVIEENYQDGRLEPAMRDAYLSALENRGLDLAADDRNEYRLLMDLFKGNADKASERLFRDLESGEEAA